VPGYEPLVDKGDLWLPEDFNYKVVPFRAAAVEASVAAA
jgi:hypothetical protein